MNGFSDVASYLIDSGADLNARNALLQTPLHLACLLGRRPLVSVLIERGGDIRLKDK